MPYRTKMRRRRQRVRRMTFFPRTRWLVGNLNWAMILTLTAHCEEARNIYTWFVTYARSTIFLKVTCKFNYNMYI